VESLSVAVRDSNCNAVYCFMPEHVHAVISGKSPASDTLMAMETFKQQTGWWLKANHPRIEWQRGFHDRIIRNPVEYAETVRYVVNNPVRAGLVERWEDYSFTGAIGLDLREHLLDMLPY
jgi:REP element-mobilizing transposase RayT